MSTDLKMRMSVERAIVKRVIHDLLANGCTLWIDHDQEGGRIDIKDTSKETLDEMFACDEDRLYVEFCGWRGWVFFVYGNDGHDVISDYTTNLENMLKGANALANRAEYHPHEVAASDILEQRDALLVVLKQIVARAKLVPCKDGGLDAAPGEGMDAGKWRVESSVDGWIADARAAIALAEQA
jgi:hypothetical protein